jgi:hypothetical protein
MSARDDLFEAIVTATVRGRYDETAMIRLVDALIVEALLKAGVQYVDCPVCGAAQAVGRPCDTCAFKARMAAELAARGLTAPADTAPFFQVGHTYTRDHHGRTIEFRVTAIDTSPDGEQRLARGWRTDEYSGWSPTDSDDITGWTDVTAAGGSRG